MLKDYATLSTTCRQQLVEVVAHVRAGQFIPLIANKSRAFLQDKANGKPGLLGQRILHLYCTFWRHWHAGALRQSVKETNPQWQDYCHAYLNGRRREGAMIVQNTVQQRLAKANIDSIGHFRDMANAFCCTGNDDRTEAVEDIIPDTCASEHRYGHRIFFEQKKTLL